MLADLKQHKLEVPPCIATNDHCVCTSNGSYHKATACSSAYVDYTIIIDR